MAIRNIAPQEESLEQSHLGRAVVVDTAIKEVLPCLVPAKWFEVRERGGRCSRPAGVLLVPSMQRSGTNHPCPQETVMLTLPMFSSLSSHPRCEGNRTALASTSARHNNDAASVGRGRTYVSQCFGPRAGCSWTQGRGEAFVPLFWSRSQPPWRAFRSPRLSCRQTRCPPLRRGCEGVNRAASSCRCSGRLLLIFLEVRGFRPASLGRKRWSTET